jgi:hypothetical protein
MDHAVERYFRQAREQAAAAYVPPAGRRVIEQNIGLKAHIQRAMPIFLTLRDNEGTALATAMLPPTGQTEREFRPIIVGPGNSTLSGARRGHQSTGGALRDDTRSRALLSLPTWIDRGANAKTGPALSADPQATSSSLTSDGDGDGGGVHQSTSSRQGRSRRSGSSDASGRSTRHSACSSDGGPARSRGALHLRAVALPVSAPAGAACTGMASKPSAAAPIAEANQ